ncbi:ammonia-forming cytochrome c nitrite reductase [Ancylomarina sp. 16SWW S1-10-2]|uniref:ammonia-forming cytochrome c nitrite reductase n=1 Tax=Ancylomarina sp. 16SWW S1-10-2 TaxID=2499681 RepID=UPI0012AD8625|nr:ammonia-forming cytochrome c nitrite reductase [Ancylomarina sp. 16SWW S1-10-2]MRT91771.1 ammonia-forming cytochrome c nitrite reductase [Ancylomarina sp. 16SWW S1-10-2]
MKPINESVKRKPMLGWLIFVTSLIVVFLLGILANSIMERRAESVFAYIPQVNYNQWEPRNEVWGENFPREFETYYNTKDTSFRSKYNGNAMIDMLEVDPRLVVLWAGYSFSKEYNQARGHYYAVKDVRNILRTGGPVDENDGPMPATCWTCKGPDVPRLMNEIGVAEFYKGKWAGKGHEVVNPIGCGDCHDSETMNLKITRPALVEAFQRQGKDIEEATHQEMRSLVCAQCHVEYYFDKKRVEGANYLTLPWDNGTTAEAMEEYYDNINFSDWTHQLSRTPMLKAQHPGYEIYSMGIHADRGVACADCHMPYKSEGGQKFTDHHIQSPLNNVANSCQVCHREETEKLIKNVYTRQDQIIENRDKLEELLVRAHVEAKKAWDLGATEDEMKPVLMDIRHGQWRWDYAAASHGGSFHAPTEIGRVISTGIVQAQEARLSLARIFAKYDFNKEVAYPDITTKAKAQKYIGLDMDKLNKEKADFKKNLIPKWEKKAEERESTYQVKK